jgi:hypothetical protein
MTHSTGAPPQPTRSLKQFAAFLGDWETVGRHKLVANPLHGHATFEWLSADALLVWRSTWEPPVPSAISVIGHDDTLESATMLYTDVRGVARIYQMSFAGGVWKYWRNSPGFSQRVTGTFSADGRTLTCQGEISQDDATWEQDLDVTYTRQG